jgi:hypothetical protein
MKAKGYIYENVLKPFEKMVKENPHCIPKTPRPIKPLHFIWGGADMLDEPCCACEEIENDVSALPSKAHKRRLRKKELWLAKRKKRRTRKNVNVAEKV